MTEDVDLALTGMLEPVYRDVLEGRATVRAVFTLGRSIKVGGIYVNDGRIARGAKLRVTRNGDLVVEGPIASLRHFQDDVREITTGFEGGVTLTASTAGRSTTSSRRIAPSRCGKGRHGPCPEESTVSTP